MSKKHSKQTERQLIEIVNNNNNLNRCGECGSDYPTWASWNLGVLLCGKCANCHKKVLGSGGNRGDAISKVKSLTLEVWSESQIEHLRSIGNRAARQKWNPKKVPFPYNDGDDDGPIETYLREKYIMGKYRYEAISDEDYDSRHGRSTPSSARSRNNNRSRSTSKSLPRLSHRKLTSYELSQYPSQARDILNLGYTDRDAIVESLILSKGDLNEALDILTFDAETNPTLAECPPDLPRRPPTIGASTSAATSTSTPPTNATAGSSDWWKGQQVAQQTAQATGFNGMAAAVAPQIYQYTDPVTGQVSYIDANGQQYLDPSNPQHQQMMMPPANPQALARQQTNQNILSLYNQPTQQAQAQQSQQGQQTQQQQQQQQQQMQPMYTQTIQPQQTSMIQGMQMGYQQPQAANTQNAYYTGQVGYAAQGYQPTQQYANQQYWG